MPKQTAKRRREIEAEIEEDEDEISTAPSMPRKRKHHVAVAEVEVEDEISANPSAARKRKQQEDEGRPRKKPKQDFAYLKSKTRKIPQEVIQSDWKKLPEPAQRQIQTILLTSKRIALGSFTEPRRKKEVEGVLDVMHRKLEMRLPRSPFPPTSKAGHFNLEEQLERHVSAFRDL